MLIFADQHEIFRRIRRHIARASQRWRRRHERRLRLPALAITISPLRTFQLAAYCCFITHTATAWAKWPAVKAGKRGLQMLTAPSHSFTQITYYYAAYISAKQKQKRPPEDYCAYSRRMLISGL